MTWTGRILRKVLIVLTSAENSWTTVAKAWQAGRLGSFRRTAVYDGMWNKISGLSSHSHRLGQARPSPGDGASASSPSAEMARALLPAPGAQSEATAEELRPCCLS